ncbi:MAG TPA: (d)CMP kinase [Burkholderiaceae bacterium]|nr:(d)CMP kinase [Burkholderiaceae bacterium]
MTIPVLTVDGPTASGKGTVAAQVAKALGFHLLDSGALYRLVALVALERGIPLDASGPLTEVARLLDARFEPGTIRLGGRDVTDTIRAEAVGLAASRIAALPSVRNALLDRQRAFRRAPGLVADGRDMGTVIFPDAVLKVFLTASVEARAERRYKQLIAKGFPANIADLSADLRERDARDTQRAQAPLKPAEDALHLDSSELCVEDVVSQVLKWWADAQRQLDRQSVTR